MAFKNTVETVGDAALSRSIIDKSITELNCNITTSIRQYAFRACAALANVNFPSVTSVANGAFYDCTALAKADFASPVAFDTNAFQNCSALTALILRNTEQISTITGTPFASSAIASGTGYIYVPAALVDQYKASWATYAAQIRAIEDYLDIIDPYSWPVVAMKIADGTYASFYKVGDLVSLDMGTEGQIDMEIVAFDADDLADGSGKAAISWIGKELLKTPKRMNPARASNDDGTYKEGTGTIGGWEKTEMRAYVQSTIKALIPSDVLPMIKLVNKTSVSYGPDGTKDNNVVTADDLWIPSYLEVIGSTSAESSGAKYTAVISSSKIKHVAGTSNAANWWIRSANTASNFRYVGSTGGNNAVNANTTTNYIALGFCT